jgi:hypothetical protein
MITGWQRGQAGYLAGYQPKWLESETMYSHMMTERQVTG